MILAAGIYSQPLLINGIFNLDKSFEVHSGSFLSACGIVFLWWKTNYLEHR